MQFNFAESSYQIVMQTRLGQKVISQIFKKGSSNKIIEGNAQGESVFTAMQFDFTESSYRLVMETR